MDGTTPLATREEEGDKEEEEEVPDLVENFDKASKSKANRIKSISEEDGTWRGD